MAGLVTASVETATSVIRKLDLEQARLVIDRDDRVDELAL